MSTYNLEELQDVSASPNKMDAEMSAQTEDSRVAEDLLDLKQDLMEPSESLAAEPVITVATEASNTSNTYINPVNQSSLHEDANGFAKTLTPTTKANLEPSATVKFVLMPMNQVVTLACPLRMTIQELKAQFASELKVDKHHLEFIHSTNESNTKNFLNWFVGGVICIKKGV